MSRFSALFGSLAATATFATPVIADPVTSGDDLTLDQVKCVLEGLAEAFPSPRSWEQPVFANSDVFNGYHFEVETTGNLPDDRQNDREIKTRSQIWFNNDGEQQLDLSIFADATVAAINDVGEVAGGGNIDNSLVQEVITRNFELQGVAARCLG